MALLDAQAILAARDRRTKIVPCSEWGGEVLLFEMGALDRIKIADWLDQLESKPDEEQIEEPLTVVTTDSPGGQPEVIKEDEPESVSSEQISEPKPRVLSALQNTEFMLRYLTASIIDPQTFQKAFTFDQIEALGSKHPKVLKRLYKAAEALNEESDEISFEDQVKNSDETAAGASGGG